MSPQTKRKAISGKLMTFLHRASSLTGHQVLTPSTADERRRGYEPRRKHLVRLVGYLHGPAPVGMDCERPLLMAVSRDGRAFEREIWPCKNHRSSICRPCAARYGRRVEAIAKFGLNVQGAFYYFLTLTAPSHRLHCKKPGCDASDCSHEKCLCTPSEGLDLGIWNPHASKYWNKFLLEFERLYGERPAYFRAVECQDGKRTADGCGRMALHLHVLLRTESSLDEKELRDLAVRNGFGHEVKLETVAPGSRKAAKYVSKYVTKSCNARDDVPWLVDEAQVDDEGELTGEVCKVPGRATFRTWSQSKDWGTTMAAIMVDVRRCWEKMDVLRGDVERADLAGPPLPADLAGSLPIRPLLP